MQLPKYVPQLHPFLDPESVVVIDNCAIHYDEKVVCIFEIDCGVS